MQESPKFNEDWWKYISLTQIGRNTFLFKCKVKGREYFKFFSGLLFEYSKNHCYLHLA